MLGLSFLLVGVLGFVAPGHGLHLLFVNSGRAVRRLRKQVAYRVLSLKSEGMLFALPLECVVALESCELGMCKRVKHSRREQLYFSVRYRTEHKFPIWPLAAQGDAMTTEPTQLAAPVPRTFAEFPFTHTWQEIAIHARRLDGATYVGIFGDGDETWLRFIYTGQDFCLQDSGARLTFTVDDASCADSILQEVQRHFAPLLAPDQSE
jgi:hypothetical protein